MPFGSIDFSEWRDRIHSTTCLLFNLKLREAIWSPSDGTALAKVSESARRATTKEDMFMAPQFRRILCPVDFDDNSMEALDTAGNIVRENNGTVFVLHVVPM